MENATSASHDGAIRTWDANTGEAGPAFDWGIGELGALQGLVGVGDVGLVVLAVVDLHGLGVDVRLEGIEPVG